MRVVLATGNPGKLQELQAMLEPLAIEVVPLSQFTRATIAETGLTFV
jgi:XTP/dITP diphosphohydrolase